MRHLPPLAALRAFEAAARHLSFKRAAAELAVTPTAISHQIRLLEDQIGLKLFERRPRLLLLTPEGQRLYPVLRDGFDAFARAMASLNTRRSRTVVTLSATRAFTSRWLVPRTTSFAAAHPGMDLRLHAADEPVDFRGATVDVAIRYGRGSFPGLKAEELFRDEFAPVASPHLGLREPGDLRRQTLIHFEWYRTDRETPIWPRWLALAGMRDLEPRAELTFTDEKSCHSGSDRRPGRRALRPDAYRRRTRERCPRPTLWSGTAGLSLFPRLPGSRGSSRRESPPCGRGYGASWVESSRQQQRPRDEQALKLVEWFGKNQ